jgi:hypothetical protein
MRPTRPIPHLIKLTSVVLTASALLACNNDPTSNDTPYVVVPVTTATLTGTPGRTLAETLVVEVRTAEGHPVPGATVGWSLPQGGSVAVIGAQLNGATTGTTDDQGRTAALWTLGLQEGTQEAKAAVGLGEPATFTASATALHALSVTVGPDYACAVLTDQTPVCWGGNSYGQLGVGDGQPRASPTPVQGLTGALQVAASYSLTYGTTCARDLGGDVWCWGSNLVGEGGSIAQATQLTPVRVPGAEGATDLALGENFSCAVLAAAGGKCWGTNNDFRMGTGQLPSGASSYPIPTSVIGGAEFVHFGLGFDRGCAVDSSSEAWCWGNANGGEFSPYPAHGYNSAIQPVPGYTFSALAVNLFSTCGIASTGEAVCFGVNTGLGHDSDPAQMTAPLVVSPNETYSKIVSDGWKFYGATRSGSLFVWGIGDCCGGVQLTPSELKLPIRVVDVAAGEYGYCVISEDGALYCDLKDDETEGLHAYPALPGS